MVFGNCANSLMQLVYVLRINWEEKAKIVCCPCGPKRPDADVMRPIVFVFQALELSKVDIAQETDTKSTIVTIRSDVSKNVNTIFDMSDPSIVQDGRSVHRKLLINRTFIFIIVSVVTSAGFITRTFVTNPSFMSFTNQTNATTAFN